MLFRKNKKNIVAAAVQKIIAELNLKTLLTCLKSNRT